MKFQAIHVKYLIESLHEFVQHDGVEIQSETFEHITITINGSINVLKYLPALHQAFSDTNSANEFLHECDGDNIELSDIEDNISAQYVDFDWQISISKLEWLKLENQTVTAFFDKDNLISSLKDENEFSRDSFFVKNTHIQIVLPMYKSEDIVGNNFIITSQLTEEWDYLGGTDFPNDTKIKEFVHVASSDSIVFSIASFALELKESEEEFVGILQTKYAEILLSVIVHVFYSKNNVSLKGLKHLSVPINNNIVPGISMVKILEKSVLWVYEENTSTRLQLLVDRLSFHECKESSLMEIAISHISEAFVEAKDRYKFVIKEKSEEYTKDLRDLLKDTKEKADKYSQKTRDIISSLLRDTLGSIFFLGLTAYSRFSSGGNFIFSEDARMIFIILGSYFLLSMTLQSIFNFWDIYLSQNEAQKWSESSLDYMTPETYDKYVTKPLKIRSSQFVLVQFAIIIIYVLLATVSFNVQSISKYISPTKSTEVANKVVQKKGTIPVSSPKQNNK